MARHRAHPRWRAIVVFAGVAMGTAAACSVDVDPVEPISGTGMLGVAAATDVDVVTDVVVADVEAYWDRVLPEVWGRDFVPVAAIAPYDSASGPTDSLPSCGGTAVERDLAVNAFYCAASDTIYWDREVLFADLLDGVGDLAVATVVAHEYGHAIQLRTGAYDDVADGVEGAVTLELQADCYAGAWLGDLAARRDGRHDAELDEAAFGLVAVRDPVGTGAADEAAHGNAFDRMSALTEGFTDGASACATYPADPPLITARTFTRSEAGTGGNLPFDELVPLLTSALDEAWPAMASEVSADPAAPPDVRPPVVEVLDGRLAARPCDGSDLEPGDLRGLAVSCVTERSVYVDGVELVSTLEPLGDFAATYPIVHAWGQMLAGPDGDAVRVGDCLAGAWSRSVFDGELPLSLSPGDLDEAIATFGVYAPTEPGTLVRVIDSTFSRFGDLRAGFLGGAAACDT